MNNSLQGSKPLSEQELLKKGIVFSSVLDADAVEALQKISNNHYKTAKRAGLIRKYRPKISIYDVDSKKFISNPNYFLDLNNLDVYEFDPMEGTLDKVNAEIFIDDELVAKSCK